MRQFAEQECLHTVCLYVPYESHNKQPLFTIQCALTGPSNKVVFSEGKKKYSVHIYCRILFSLQRAKAPLLDSRWHFSSIVDLAHAGSRLFNQQRNKERWRKPPSIHFC
jgi:hypothetical protein